MHPVLIAAARGDVRPPLRGPLHPRRQPRRAAVRRRGARHPRGGPQQDVRRGDRRHPRDLGARAALRHRPAGQPLQGVDRAHAGAARSASAISASPTRSRGRRSSAPWWRRSRKGVVAMGKRDFHPLSANFLLPKWLQDALGELLRRARRRSAPRPTSPTGGSRARSSSPTTTRRRRATAAPTPTAPTGSTDSQMLAKMNRGKRLYVFKSHKDQPDDEITLDYVMDQLRDPRQRQQGGRPAPRVARGDRRLRRDRLRRHGLGRSGARPALDGADGRARSCRASTPRSASLRRLSQD